MINYTPTPDYYNDYIAHHGVDGQKWGVQNGPPYPLDSKISTGKRLKSIGASRSPQKVAEDNQDMFNDILQRERYSLSSSDRKQATKDFNEIVKEISKDENVSKKELEKIARKTFQQYDKEQMKLAAKSEKNSTSKRRLKK